jgi:hypothetical protein
MYDLAIQNYYKGIEYVKDNNSRNSIHNLAHSYSNMSYPLKDIVYAGDKILVANNTERTVQSVDWVNGTIVLSTNLTSYANSLMSVQRTLIATDVIIYGPQGLQYTPELVTQNGENIATQDNNILILG